MLQQAINTLRFVSSFKPFEINVLKLPLMKKYDFPLREINLFFVFVTFDYKKKLHLRFS